MSWTDFVSHLLATTHKIEKAAVLNIEGQSLAVTEGLSISNSEGLALVKSLSDSSRSITRLHIDNNFYTLFQGNDITVIGVSPDRDRVFVAHRWEDHVVVAFGNTTGHGSFLFELKKNLMRKHQSELHPETQRQSQHGSVISDKPNKLLENIILESEIGENGNVQEQLNANEQLSLSDSEVLLQMN